MWQLLVAIIIVIIVIVLYYYYGKSYTLPAGITNGSTVQCNTAPFPIYGIENNTKRWYPNPTIYAAHGSPAYTSVDCTILAGIPNGADYS